MNINHFPFWKIYTKKGLPIFSKFGYIIPKTINITSQYYTIFRKCNRFIDVSQPYS